MRIILWNASRFVFPPEHPSSTNGIVLISLSSGMSLDLQYSSCVSHEILFSFSIDCLAYKAIANLSLAFFSGNTLLPAQSLRILHFRLKTLYKSWVILSFNSFASETEIRLCFTLCTTHFKSVNSDTWKKFVIFVIFSLNINAPPINKLLFMYYKIMLVTMSSITNFHKVQSYFF